MFHTLSHFSHFNVKCKLVTFKSYKASIRDYNNSFPVFFRLLPLVYKVVECLVDAHC